MIVTLTPNPSIDRTVNVPALLVGAVNRVRDVRQDPGGKGVNVSRALAQHQADTVAVMPLGGAEGDMLARLLQQAHVPLQQVTIEGQTRINLTVAGADGVTTKINEPGPHLPAATVEELIRTTVAAADGGWILGAGSLSAGMDETFYARLVATAHEAGASIAIDSSGEAMRHAVASGPDLIKPNHHELGEMVGRTLTTLGAVIEAAQQVRAEHRIAHVVVSLGGSGAIAVSPEGVLYARAPKVKPVSTVGAGDALLAGFLLGQTRQASLSACLELGIQFGTAAVTLPGSQMPGPQDITNVTVTFIDHIDLDEAVEE